LAIVIHHLNAVFISYARSTNAAAAHSLKDALGDDAFLDKSDIEDGDQFPAAIVEALLRSRVVVVFADDVYFTRWYCLRELNIALTPYDLALRSGATDLDSDAALRNIVIALPEGGPPVAWDLLPPQLRVTNWPRADETARLVVLVRNVLATASESLSAKLSSYDAARIRDTLLEESKIPPPGAFPACPFFHPSGQMTPSINERFVGRANDLASIHFTLCRSGPKAAISGYIAAAGGFGKTRLAIEYVWRYATRYFEGGVFWIDASADASRLEEQFYGILNTLPRAKPLPPLVEMRRNGSDLKSILARELRTYSARGPVLCVIDNLPEVSASCRPRPLEEYCPGAGLISILATSRQATFALGVRALTLNILPRTASILLLTMGFERAGELTHDEWSRISQWVGDLPLALELLNAALQAGFNPMDLLSESSRSDPSESLDGHLQSIAPFVPEGALRGISETFGISFNFLDAESQGAALRLAWLGADPIPVAIVDAMNLSEKGRVGLRSRHLVTGATNEMFGSMHTVLASYLRSRSDPAVFYEALTMIERTLDSKDWISPQNWPLYQSVDPHVVALFEAAQRGRCERKSISLACSLATTVGVSRRWQGDLKGAFRLHEGAMKFAEVALGREDPVTATSMHRLADTLLELGDLAAARQMYDDVVEIKTRVFGAESPETLQSMLNLGNCLRKQGSVREARILIERVVQGREHIYGDVHEETMSAYHVLASIMWSQGDFQAAQELDKSVLESHQRSFGREHPRTLAAMNNLATTFADGGDLARASNLLEEAVEISTRTLSTEHLITLTLLNSQAETLSKLGKREESYSIHAKVFEIRQRLLGKVHPDTLVSMHNLALSQPEPLAALKECTSVLDIKRQVLGPDHRSTLASMSCVIYALLTLDRLSEARAMIDDALPRCCRVMGDSHPLTKHIRGYRDHLES
jgi:tetratricopeptide (TPR) repeat protein